MNHTLTSSAYSNKADLELLRSTGIKLPPRPIKEKKATFRTVAFMIRATVRMRKGAEQWAKSRKIHEALVAKVESMKKKEAEAKKKESEGLKRKGSRKSVTY
jgi:hypothetical protein